MTRWDVMTKKAWENSEVMKELEESTKQTIKNFVTIAGVIDSANKAKQSLESANVSAKQLLHTLGEKNLTDDQMSEDKEGGENSVEVISIEISDEEHTEAKEKLIEELRDLVHEYGSKGEVELAYKLERLITELEEEVYE
jgi:hypothetical protein